MGALAQSMGTAAGAAKGATALSILSTGLNAVGDYSAGVGQAQQYNYQAQVVANNAAITRENAKSEIAAGGYAESAKKMETTQLLADQKVAQAANGVDVSIGSAPAVRDSAATLGAMDAAMIHFNAARSAYGLEAEAANLDTQSNLYRTAAGNAKKVGAGKAFTSILEGATALSSRWAQYKQAFPAKGA